jgi:very-short-patch-repair endonuclease
MIGRTVTLEEEKEIVKKYTEDKKRQSIISKEHKLGLLRIKNILLKNNVEIKIPGANRGLNSKEIEEFRMIVYSSKDKQLIAKCKKTDITFKDINNEKGILTDHILKTYGDIDYPKTTYAKKRYEYTHGKKWYEEYIDIIEIDKKETRKCKLCNWETLDLTNKTGCFEVHLKNNHNVSIIDYLNIFPEDIKFHPKYKKLNSLKEDNVICEICGYKMKFLNTKHLKTHNIGVMEYKLRYPSSKMVSNSCRKKLQDSYNKNLKNHEHKFTSKAQETIQEYLINLGCEININDKKLLNGIEIDILLPEHKLGIEFNGLYYHTERMGKDKNFHLNKTKLMNENGYKLIHIFEDEWIKNKGLVLNKISHLINKNNSKIIGARKCEIIEIDNETKNIFLELYHIQGKSNSNINLGAIYNDELVAVMSFDNKRSMVNLKNNKNHYDLTRFATNTNYKVVGIAGKLLKYFINNYKPNKIISFGDVRWVLDKNDNMYTKLGFSLNKTLLPDYKYFKSNISRSKRLHKFGFGKNALRKRYPDLDFNKTEKELMIELGFDRIWDCGLFKFELNLEN